MTRINVFTVKQVKESGGNYDVGKKIKTPKDVADVIESVLKLSESANEQLGILCLNVKNEIVGIHIISKGLVDSTLGRPREIFMAAMLNNASNIILFHNHPSGDITPSSEDVQMTKRIYQASKIMGIDLLDHVIIGDYGDYGIRYSSLKELNLMEGGS